jgi:hypothetical protein
VADSHRVDAIVGLLAGIAAAEGWHPSDHLTRFRDRSEYFGVWRGPELTAPVGALQLVRADAWGEMPCRLFWPDADISRIAGGDARKVGEVLVLALAPSVRGRGDLFWSLGAALFRRCRDSGITDLVAEVPPRNLPLYRRLGWPFRIVGDLAIHWGEPCYFCSLNVAEVEAAVRAKAELGSSHHAQAVANAYREVSQL